MKHFLLDYDRPAGKLVCITTFKDVERALVAYSACERRAHGTSHEIVLLGAESEDELRQTHSRYFYDIDEMIERGVSRYREQVAARTA